jgi:hypothetical protein
MKRWIEQSDATSVPRRQASAHTLALTIIFTVLVLFAGIDTICPSFMHQFFLEAGSQSQAGVVSPTYRSFDWAQVCTGEPTGLTSPSIYTSLATESLSKK